MPTLQNKIMESFDEIISEIRDNLDIEELKEILNKIIDLAVKEDRGENIDTNLNAQTNNIIELLEK